MAVKKQVLKHYIAERNNPQLLKPSYIACGQLSAKEVKEYENVLYGSMLMLSFDTKEEYEQKILTLKEEGFKVRDSIKLTFL